MKIYLNILCLCLITTLTSTTLLSQNWGIGEKGKGEVVSKDLHLDNFTGIELGFNGDVIITQGASQKVRVEGQQNIIDLINTDISKGTWKIDFVKNVNNHKNLTIYITIPTLTKIGVSGSGNIKTTNSFDNLGDLGVFVSGSGNLKLDVSAKSIKSRISGSGNITLKGNSNSQEIKISGSGDVNAYDMKVEEAVVHISGSGECELNVSKSLEVRISGSGDVYYKGDPNVKAKVSGSGDVKKKG